MHTSIFALALVLCPSLLLAATIHVPADQPTIQAGINEANAGDSVILASGIYTWDSEGIDGHYDDMSGWSMIRLKAGVILTSTTGQSDCVIIDAQQQGRVILYDDIGAAASISGFTISGGQAGRDVFPAGGGLLCIGPSAIAAMNCVFLGNSGQIGGGAAAMNWDGAPYMSFANCAFTSNSSLGGGAAAVSSSSFSNCEISDNIGGGLFVGGTSSIDNCTFEGNSGGGLRYLHGTITNCTFIGNSGGLASGLEVTWNTSPTISNCTFVGNSASSHGVVSCAPLSSPTFTNCIIAFNSSGEALYTDRSSPVLHCCDIFGNTDGDWTGYIEDQLGANGNISDDPIFCDAEGGDLTLADNSPCAPGNNTCGVLIGALPVACVPIATDESSWSKVKSLY